MSFSLVLGKLGPIPKPDGTDPGGGTCSHTHLTPGKSLLRWLRGSREDWGHVPQRAALKEPWLGRFISAQALWPAARGAPLLGKLAEKEAGMHSLFFPMS